MGSRRPRADAAPFNIQHYIQQSLKQGETGRDTALRPHPLQCLQARTTKSEVHNKEAISQTYAGGVAIWGCSPCLYLLNKELSWSP